MASIEGYHVNSKEKCQDFLNKNISWIVSADKEYLGKGMYFWDNKANAKYWFIQRRKKLSNSEFMVVSCNLSLDYLLDLTDIDIVTKMDRLWRVIEKRRVKERLPEKAGARLDYIRKYDSLVGRLTVYKMIAQYDRNEPKYAIGNSYMAYNVKTIYCVKDPEAIISEPVECTKEVVA